MDVDRYNAVETYIEFKYGNPTRSELIAFRRGVAAEIEAIKADKSEVYENGPSVHGAAQHSRLDVLDMNENSMCQIFDNVSLMISQAHK